MKTLYNSKRFLATVLRRYGRVLSLIVALSFTSAVQADYYTKYNVKSDNNDYSNGDYVMSEGRTVSGGKCEWEIACRAGNNYFYFSNSPSTVNVSAPGAKTNNSQNVNSIENTTYGSYTGARVNTKKACTLKITFYEAGGKVDVSDGSSPTPASHAPSIRIGKQPTTDGNTATINLQMADWGCAEVNKVKIYYTTDGTEPTKSSPSTWEITTSQTSNNNFDVEKSDLSEGTYNIKVAAVNTAGEGELSDMATFTVEKICTQPQAANFHVSGLTDKTYTGTKQSPAINPDEGMGTMTVKYNGVAGTGKTDAGTYAITVSVAKGTIFCASTEDISLGDFVIGKANREISISNTEQSLATCENNTITLTSTTTAPEDGTITYSTVSGGTGAGSIDGDKLSCTTAGTVKVQVSITGGTNYNDATSNQATATFYALPTAGSITASPASPICKGTSTTLTVAGFTEGSTLQWYKGSSILTGQTSASYITEALSEAATYKVVVTKNNCISETSDFTVEVKSTSLKITATPAVVNPYTPVTLIAKNQSGTETNSNWTITGAGSYFTESENPTGVSTVVMKPAKDVETTVTATATVDGCPVSDTYSVTPTADTETCN